MRNAALGIVIVLSTGLASGQDRPPGPAPAMIEPIVIEKCLVEYERTATIGAFVLIQAGGRIQESYVRPGTRVKAGQIMGRLHDRDARAEWARLTHEIEDNVEIPLAESKLAQSRLILVRSRNLFKKGMYNREKMEQEELDVRGLELELQIAKHRRRQDELTRLRVEAEISSREMLAPHDGVVVEVLKQVGESTAVNEPVYRIVDLDLLRVTGQLDVRDTWRVTEGQPVRIKVELANGNLPIERETFTGHITFVNPLLDPETRTCKVVAVVNNHDGLLRSGLEARMEIDLDPVSAKAERQPLEPKSASVDPKGSVR